VEATRSDDEPDLAPVHGHGELRTHRGARDLSRRRVDTGWDIHCNDGNARAVDALDQRRRVSTWLALEPRSE